MSEVDKLLNSVQGKTLSTIQEEQKKSMESNTKASDILNSVVTNSNIVTVNGTDYEIEKYTITEWMKVTPYLGKQFGVPLAMGLGGAFSDEETDENTLAEAMFVLFGNLENGGLEKVANLLLVKVKIAGAPVKIEDFVNPYDLFEVCAHVLLLNYNDFFTKGISKVVEGLGKMGLVATTLSQE